MTTEIRLFGSLQVMSEGRELGVRDFGGRKPKQLLQILLLHEGRYVSKEQLADRLWGEALPVSFAGSLEHYVSLLRKRLQPSGTRRESLLVTGHGGYRFACERAWVDTLVFKELSSRPEAGVELSVIEQALGLVRGDLLEDEPYPQWASEARDFYTQRRVRLLVAGADAALAHRQLEKAGQLAEAALAIDPLVEPAYQALMLAHYVRGHQSEALQTYRSCQRKLSQEVGVDPMAETVDLHQAMLSGANPASLLPAPRSETPARAGVPAIDGTRQLPLMGRLAELDAVQSIATTRHGAAGIPLVTIDGEAGVGKTRVLDELARRLNESADVKVLRLNCSELERADAGGLARDLLWGLETDGSRLENRRTGTQAQDDPPDFRRSLAHEIGVSLRDNEPFAVFVDDAQWADPESVALLSRAARRLVGLRGVFVFACRTEDVPEGHPLQSLETLMRVQLNPLTPVELAPFAEALHPETGGLPLYVGALLEEGVMGEPGSVPNKLREAVLERFRRVSSDLTRVATAAALVPQPCGPEEVARLLRSSPIDVAEHMEALCELSILAVDDRGFAFRYPVVMRVLEDTVSPARRRLLARMHRRADSPPSRRLVEEQALSSERRESLGDRRATDLPQQRGEALRVAPAPLGASA